MNINMSSAKWCAIDYDNINLVQRHKFHLLLGWYRW